MDKVKDRNFYTDEHLDTMFEEIGLTVTALRKLGEELVKSMEILQARQITLEKRVHMQGGGMMT